MTPTDVPESPASARPDADVDPLPDGDARDAGGPPKSAATTGPAGRPGAGLGPFVYGPIDLSHLAATAPQAPAPPIRSMRSRRSTRQPPGLLIGVLAGLVALLPRLLGAVMAPLQEQWFGPLAPREDTFSLLPLGRFDVHLIVAIAVAGAVCAALALRSRGTPLPRTRRRAMAGLGAVLAGCVVESFAVLALGGAGSVGVATRHAARYFWALLAGTLVVFGLALGLLWWLTSPCVVRRTIAWALAAIPLAVWAMGLLLALAPSGRLGALPWWLMRWLPAVIVGAALVRCGVRPLRRLVGWVAALAVLLFVPALMVGVTATPGLTRVLRNPAEIVGYAGRVLAQTWAHLTWEPVALALLIGGAGAVVTLLVGPLFAGRPQPTRT